MLTLGLKGHLHIVFRQIEFSSEHAWILHFPVTSLPSGSIGVQTSVLAILAGSENCEDDMEKAISSKLSLGEDLFDLVVFQSNWLDKVNQVFC